MKESRIHIILEEIYKIHDYDLYNVIVFVIDHMRNLEDLLNRKLSIKEKYEEIDSALLYLVFNK